jgi:hypothetical protein
MPQALVSLDPRPFAIFSFFALMLAVSFFLLLVPVIQLLRRTEHYAAWALCALIPGLNVIAFWFFAFKPWPKDTKPLSK